MIEPIFNMFKVKFDKMDELGVISGKNDVVIYIDMENIFKVLFNQRTNDYAKSLRNFEHLKLMMISCVVNTASHYKLYCNKAGIQSKVVMYMNYYDMETLANREIIPDYKVSVSSKLNLNSSNSILRRALDQSIDGIRKICKYMQGVYFVTDTTVDSAVIPYILQKEYPESQGIIVSSSPYNYQYIKHGFEILEPRADKTELVNKHNVNSVLKRKNSIKSDINLPTSFIPLALAILGDVNRNIVKLPKIGLSTAIKLIDKSLNDATVTENTSHIGILCDVVDESLRDHLSRNFMVTDVESQYDRTSLYTISCIKKQLEDQYDDTTLQELNEKLFKLFPIIITNNYKEKYTRVARDHWGDRPSYGSLFTR